jgi:hypothetical protein
LAPAGGAGAGFTVGLSTGRGGAFCDVGLSGMPLPMSSFIVPKSGSSGISRASSLTQHGHAALGLELCDGLDFRVGERNRVKEFAAPQFTVYFEAPRNARGLTDDRPLVARFV